MRLALRIACGLGCAIGALYVLQRAVRTADARAAARAEPAAATVAAPEPRLPPVQVSRAAGRILLASRPEAVPADAAPVVQVLADGSHAIRRPAPLPTRPGLGAGSTAAAAIVLPGRDLRRLDPRARATFAEVVGRLVAERPVPSSRFVTQDFPLAVADLEAVLRWIP